MIPVNIEGKSSVVHLGWNISIKTDAFLMKGHPDFLVSVESKFPHALQLYFWARWVSWDWAQHSQVYWATKLVYLRLVYLYLTVHFSSCQISVSTFLKGFGALGMQITWEVINAQLQAFEHNKLLQPVSHIQNSSISIIFFFLRFSNASCSGRQGPGWAVLALCLVEGWKRKWDCN